MGEARSAATANRYRDQSRRSRCRQHWIAAKNGIYRYRRCRKCDLETSGVDQGLGRRSHRRRERSFAGHRGIRTPAPGQSNDRRFAAAAGGFRALRRDRIADTSRSSRRVNRERGKQSHCSSVAMKKVRRLRAMTVMLLVVTAAAVRGQSARDGFDPNANGAVRIVVVQPDGKILLGGDFTALSPNGGVAVTRNRIARLNPDGTLDTAFNPNANVSVWSIAGQAGGQVLSGGHFTSIGGQTRNNIARLDTTNGLADSFDPNASNIVRSIAVQADGKILAGGNFINIGGQTRVVIARLDATTGLADSFNPNANSIVFSIAVQADGKILAGGRFTGARSTGGTA